MLVNKPKAIVIGIDGLSYPVTQKLIQQNKLPNIKRFFSLGCIGELKSTFPPHTAPGWASMFTGVNPGAHGIFQFWQTQSNNYSPRITLADDFQWEPCWKTLENNGLSVGIVNVPMSHPPEERKKNGYMITWPLSPTLHYSYPPGLVKDLARKGLHFHSDLVTMYRGQSDYLNEAKKHISGRTDTLLHLMEEKPVDVVFCVYTEVDRVSHYYWGEEIEPGEDIESIYQETDRAIGRILDWLEQGVSENGDSETIVFLASDHGFGHCSKNLNVHRVLENAGLLTTKLVCREKKNSSSSDELIGETKNSSWFHSSESYFRTIDWEKTLAYMPTPGCFGINLNIKGREDKGIVSDCQDATDSEKQVIYRLKECFRNLTDSNGIPYFSLRESELVYSGKALDQAPDLLLIPSENYWDIMPHTGMEPEIWTKPSQIAIHREEGIWGMIGKGVQKETLFNAKIEDIASTLLAHLGCPLYQGIEGKAHFISRDELRFIEPKFETKEGTSLSDSEVELLKEKLIDLGYA